MKRILFYILSLSFFISCVDDNDFDAPQNTCVDDLVANATFAEVKALFNGEIMQIQEDLIIEGYVVSSDRAGNFFSVLHFQDSPTNPTEGFQIEIDLREAHLFFQEGSRIFIKLKGLYLNQTGSVYRLGGTFAAFGTLNVGRLPALQIPEHIFLSCDATATINPTVTSIANLNDTMLNTLVQLDNLELSEAQLVEFFALQFEETERTLNDCFENELILLNSGFSEFQSVPLPEGNGSIVGVLLKDNNDFQIAIRDLEDLNFIGERCEAVITEFTSTAIFISELADPNNNSGARFVELYNASNEDFNLNGWTLRRYTNANTTISSTLDLSGFTIGAQSTLVISPNSEEFELVYGFAPDVGVSTNSPADSNGDDNLELVDPFETVIDVFGIIGEDGSGTNHEFEDGKAIRNIGVTIANPIFNFNEWIIFNDTGEAGTTNLTQNAPDDFSPSVR